MAIKIPHAGEQPAWGGNGSSNMKHVVKVLANKACYISKLNEYYLSRLRTEELFWFACESMD